MERFAVVLFMIIIAIVSFFVGSKLTFRNVDKLPSSKLNQNLALQTREGHEGILPMGSRLYAFKDYGEGSTYIVFVNLKSQEVLSPIETISDYSVSPITAYPKREGEKTTD